MASNESKNMSRNVSPIVGHNQLMKRVIQIFNLLDREFEFSRSFSSIMICPADIEDSNCLARHCSVFNISLLWQPYSFLSTIGRDSARFTLKNYSFMTLDKNERAERHHINGGRPCVISISGLED